MLRLLLKLRPAVHKHWLQLAAGLVWLGVGLMLDDFAANWLRPVALPRMLLLVLAGMILAAGIYTFGFSRLARKNIQRITDLPGRKVCLFAFQAWPSYPLVGFMIGLGIYLRVYSGLPKPMLAILYLGIGTALFASSLLYFARLAASMRPVRVEDQG